MGTYLQGYGDALVAINDWDPAVLERFRADDVVRSMTGAIDAVATTDQLHHIETLIPPEWLPAAVGSPAQCATRIGDQFAQGADGVILHGATPDQLVTTVEAWRAVRPVGVFDTRSTNPGR
jgi:alkanesulfonate monooxygenase SsuD/methylene tetrahydromethanopterin reductase-like flavin-dependent oxidoreductase (luciferase family)